MTKKKKEKKEKKPDKEDDKHNKKKNKRQLALVEYNEHTVTLLTRRDLVNPTEVHYTLFTSIPNKHKKLPQVQARTPNVAVDNLVLWNNPENEEINVALAWYDKESTTVGDKKLQGWCMPGGHVEYHEDMSLEAASLRELEEEFHIKEEDIVLKCTLAVVDDFIRDLRNKYITTVFGYFSNSPPRASEEHKTIISFPLSKLEGLIKEKGKLLHPKIGEEFGFVHGHDSVLAKILGLNSFKKWVKEVEDIKIGSSAKD